MKASGTDTKESFSRGSGRELRKAPDVPPPSRSINKEARKRVIKNIRNMTWNVNCGNCGDLGYYPAAMGPDDFQDVPCGCKAGRKLEFQLETV